MSIKKSIRLADKAHAFCVLSNPSRDGNINWSGALNQIAERYDFLLSEVMPDLTSEENLAWCDIYNGRILHPDLQQELRSMPFTVSECIQYQPFDHLLEDISVEEFYEKADKYSMIERLAILDMIQKFWNQTYIKQLRLEDTASLLLSYEPK